jgi:predicted ferric reductase
MLLRQPSRSSHGLDAGPLLLAGLCLVPGVLWLTAEPLGNRFAGSYMTLSSVAVLLASTGMTAFGLNLVLGARLRAVGRLFGGLDRMYAIHRRTGEAAFALLAGHVVLVIASRVTISPDSAVALLGPGAGWTVFAGVLAFAAMTVSLALTLFARLGHEVFVYVQRSFGVVFALGAYHALTTDSWHGSTGQTAYLATVSTIGLAAFGYRSVFGNSLVRRRRYHVTAVNRLDEHVTEIVMRPVGRSLDHEPGQFVFVNFDSLELTDQLHPIELSVERQVLSLRPGEIRRQFHPFSITSAPGAPELRITVKALGDYTSALRRLEPGAEALVEGPFGTFSHRSLEGDRQVWLAGGIGVTPFLSMARSLGAEPGPAVAFYYCAESEDEAHFVDELRAIARSREGFTITVVPRDRDGFLTGARIAAEQGGLSSADVLVCGPPAMIDSLRTQLAGEGVPPGRLHAEEL